MRTTPFFFFCRKTTNKFLPHREHHQWTFHSSTTGETQRCEQRIHQRNSEKCHRYRKKKKKYIYFAVGRATGRVVGSIPGLVRSYVVRFSAVAPFLFFLQSRVYTPDFTSPAHRTLSGAVQSCFLLFSHSRWIPSTHHGASAANSPSGTRTR